MRHLAAFIRWIDRLNEWIGRGVAVLTVFMVVVVFVVVVLRYVFSIGWVWMQETYVWAHGIVFLIGAAYTLLHEGHVRIDVVYRAASPRYKAWINLLGSVFMGLPVTWVIFSKSLPYVLRSWRGLEASVDVGGLPGLFVLKTVIPVFCVLFALQIVAIALRSLATLLGDELPPSVEIASRRVEDA